ncbi:endonuclease/exonuclease/phosphatase family protein [Sulfitobacter sediminilitoris]|uniref:endonuclease/exonuclease/phosphatase family protein n=1 Tax=Sulfitobacter sediminilitoris TaxID=2698830 RepID=UPI00361AEFD7
MCAAETLRVATFNTELSRKGPGLLLRDIARANDPQINAVIAEIRKAGPDVIALQGFDFDLENTALEAFAVALEAQGQSYPYFFAAPPNAGLQTDLDLDGDNQLGGPGDAQGYGRFFGQGSMAIMSRYPVLTAEVEDHSQLLWRKLPNALLPEMAGKPFPSEEALEVQRLSSHGHWIVPILHPVFGRVSILTYHATPPVFDRAEDRNGKRNHDETAFWVHYLNGSFGGPPDGQFLLVGDANLDPQGGDGRGQIMATLLSHPMLQDPLPDLETVMWQQTGPLRVDYVLPSSDWKVIDAGVMPINPAASRHALVWVDVTR